MEEGSYPAITMQGGKGESGRSSYVTIRPKGSAVVIFTGAVELRNSSYERWEHIHFDAPFNLYDGMTYSGSHDYEFLYDAWENPNPTAGHPDAGLGIEGGRAGSGGGPLRRVTVEHSYFYGMEIESPGAAGLEGQCKAGSYGQALGVGYAEGIVFKHNTVNEVGWHYIQGGSQGSEGMTVENNLFMGYEKYPCEHLNVWQIYSASENDTFKNNIIIGKGTRGGGGEGGTGVGPFGNGSEEAAKNWLMWENGGGSSECAQVLKNLKAENNLVVDANRGQANTIQEMTFAHNTIVGSNGAAEIRAEPVCGKGENYTITHNLAVEGDVTPGASTGAYLFDYNVSTDTSADAGGSTHYLTKWKPSWITTSWSPFKEVEEGNHFPKPPAGYYIPTGLAIEAGYDGSAGP